MTQGMDWMDEVKKYFGLKVVTEVTEIRHIDRINQTADIMQIAKKYAKFRLLRELALTKKPLILKRHFGASLRDMLGAAEHILVEGTPNLFM